MIIRLNSQDRKLNILTKEDAYVMRLNVVKRLINVLYDYARLPDIEKEEKDYILKHIKELNESINRIEGMLKS